MNSSNSELTDKQRSLLYVFFALAFIARLAWLGNIPGINGDEAWYGIQALNGLDFSQRTPTGNFLNAFYVIPLFIIQRLFPPGFWVLRSVSFLSGLAVIITGYFLLRKSLGERPALFFVMICAGLPDLVAYSRFGWDTSQTGLATLLLLYFSMEKKWGYALLAQAIALIIHPANVFLAFIPINIFLWDAFRLKRPVNKTALRLLVLPAVILFTGFYLFAIKLGDPAIRIRSIKGWVDFFVLYGDLISGVTVYRYIVGPISNWNVILHSIVFWMIVAPVILMGCRNTSRRNFQPMAMLFGIGMALAAMYILFGNRPISPHFERYSQFLVVPTALLLALGLDSLDLKISRPLSVFIGAFWIVSLAFNYFLPFHLTGGLSHQTFRTAPIEPKQQAVDIVLDNVRPGDNGIVLAENWWIALPMRYLLVEHKNITVIQFDDASNTLDAIGALENGGFVVTFSKSKLDETIAQSALSGNLKKWVILDFANNPIIHVWRMSN